ncbi:MAG: 6-bladed beta-propeller [Bacteroidota bacterium]
MISGKRLIISFSALMIMTGPVLAQQLIKTDTSHYLTLRIDPENANGATAAQVFDEVKYIPLETTPESLFGSIGQLEVFEGGVIILDNSTNCILIFSKDGKFHAKIKGNADKIRYPIRCLAINKWTKQIVYTGDRNKSFTYCDLDGKEVKKVEYGRLKNDELGVDKYYYIAPDKIVNYAGYNDIDSTDKRYNWFSQSALQYAKNIKTVYAKGMVYKTAKNTMDMGRRPFTNWDNDTTFYLSAMWPYRIYTITPNAIKLSYKFIFPLLSTLDEGLITNLNKDPTVLMDFFQKHKKEVYALDNCYKAGNNLLFEAKTWELGLEEALIYNLKSGTLIAYQHISPDESTCFLPLYDRKGIVDAGRGVINCDGKNVYVSISSLGMFTAKNDYSDKAVKYPAALAQYFTKGNIKDNPIILQLKLKDKL